MKPTGQLVRIADLSLAQRDEMFALMSAYYEHVRRPTFDADLAEKEWAIVILDESTDRILGFSTQMLMCAEVEGRPVLSLFSGDTIIDRDARRQRSLFEVSGWFVRSLIEAHPDEELYWFLISKGYKTYHFLPLFFHEYYPRHDAPTPPRFKAVIDALAERKFGDAYDRVAGVVRADASSCRLRPGVADIAERMNDPHVGYFAERNPGHERGDELCCIAPLTLSNFTRAAYRAMGPSPGVKYSEPLGSRGSIPGVRSTSPLGLHGK